MMKSKKPRRLTSRALFAIFGRRLYANITSHVAAGECAEWCEEAMDIATEIGLARQEIYNPEIHGGMDAEPGVSAIWTWRHLPDGWQADQPAVEFLDPVTGAAQQDLSKRGILILHDSAALTNDCLDAAQTHRRVLDWKSQGDEGLRLRCGELSPQEIRTIRAVLHAILPHDQTLSQAGRKETP